MSDHPIAACPECGKAIWGLAATCSECGADIREWLGRLGIQSVAPVDSTGVKGPVTEPGDSGDVEFDPAGYIYILSNPHYAHLLKIGKTKRSVEERAAELSSVTGVPGEFQVLWKAHIADCDTAEKLIHAELDVYRIDGEFFSIELSDAVEVLKRICRGDQGQREQNATSKSLTNESKGQLVQPTISRTRAMSPLCPRCKSAYSVTLLRGERYSFCPHCGVGHGIEVDW